MTTQSPEVAIVGGGVAGSALAISLARAGIAVTILEKSTVHVDRVRGEWLAPWGVAETERLQLYAVLRAAGGHHLQRHIPYSEETPIADAEARAMDFSGLPPPLKSPLCMRHPVMCDTLNREAADDGAILLRGVADIVVRPGERPEVSFHHDGRSHTLKPRIVIAADGRNSVVRGQLGIELHRGTPHHLMAGLLVDGIDGWPAGLETIGTESDTHFLVFPQGPSRARLYICYGRDQKRRFAGDDGAASFLEAFRLKCVSGSEYLARGFPAGPCNSYANEDAWTDAPYVPGVVLIGDAAGHNDPIIGQGLSIAYRDVRIVRDLMLDDRDWRPELFAPYAEERAERMRRLRFTASRYSELFVEFGPEARARRKRVMARMFSDPELAVIGGVAFLGPERFPSHLFTEEAWRRTLAA
jgi:2-polyprenyl-6-methoxyphenol hydroxylase-like FAD-dependent oxidoreductase